MDQLELEALQVELQRVQAEHQRLGTVIESLVQRIAAAINGGEPSSKRGRAGRGRGSRQQQRLPVDGVALDPGTRIGPLVNQWVEAAITRGDKSAGDYAARFKRVLEWFYKTHQRPLTLADLTRATIDSYLAATEVKFHPKYRTATRKVIIGLAELGIHLDAYEVVPSPPKRAQPLIDSEL